MSKKLNKFKVGDVVQIISLEKTISRYGGKGFLLPIGSISRIKYMDDIDEVYLQDGFYYDTADLKLATKETTNSSNEPIKKTLYSPLTVQQAGDHYKKKGIQPIEYGLANNLSFPQVNVVKYITRH